MESGVSIACKTLHTAKLEVQKGTRLKDETWREYKQLLIQSDETNVKQSGWEQAHHDERLLTHAGGGVWSWLWVGALSNTL